MKIYSFSYGIIFYGWFIMIIENGFLDEKHNDLININKKNNYELFELLFDFNKLLYKVLNNFNGMKKNNEIDYIVPAFAKLIKLYQSCVILIEYGMPDVSESLLRSIYDLKIQMLYVLENDTNYKRLIKSLFSNELNKLDNIDKYSLYDFMPKEMVDSYREKWQTTYEELNQIKCAPKTKQMCEELGLEQDYLFYSILCNDSHQSCDVIYSLNKEEGIDILPNFKKSFEASFKLISAFDVILEKIIKKYAPHLTKHFEDFVNRFNSFVEKNKEE